MYIYLLYRTHARVVNEKMTKSSARQHLHLLSPGEQVLRHENIVVLLEVFTHQGNLMAVFELLDHSIMDELDQRERALDSLVIRKYTFQMLRALEFVHSHHVNMLFISVMQRGPKCKRPFLNYPLPKRSVFFFSTRSSTETSSPTTCWCRVLEW